jgi:hypothetical protein
MSLYTRLMGIDQPKIPSHQFGAAIAEYSRGKWTRQNVIDAFGLSAGEATDLDTIFAKVIAVPESYALGAAVTLTNVGSSYDAITNAKGLGFVVLDVGGITKLTCRVRYNKVGTGTLTWQLWNETDTSELGTLDDAAAAGDNRQGDIIVTPGSPLSASTKLIRVRVKSTVATDDPVYYGACLFLQRIDRLTADDLHGLLMLAESQYGPMDTEAEFKARLGV